MLIFWRLFSFLSLISDIDLKKLWIDQQKVENGRQNKTWFASEPRRTWALWCRCQWIRKRGRFQMRYYTPVVGSFSDMVRGPLSSGSRVPKEVTQAVLCPRHAPSSSLPVRALSRLTWTTPSITDATVALLCIVTDEIFVVVGVQSHWSVAFRRRSVASTEYVVARTRRVRARRHGRRRYCSGGKKRRSYPEEDGRARCPRICVRPRPADRPRPVDIRTTYMWWGAESRGPFRSDAGGGRGPNSWLRARRPRVNFGYSLGSDRRRGHGRRGNDTHTHSRHCCYSETKHVMKKRHDNRNRKSKFVKYN